MKLNKIFAAILAVVTLVTFSACDKKDGQDVIKLKLSKVTLSVGQSYSVPVEQASGEITWASSNEAVATVAAGVISAKAEGTAAVTATVGTAKATIDVTVTGGSDPQGDETPDVAAPEDGFVTIVINIPAGTECKGIALKGTYDNSSWSGANTYLGENGSVGPDDCIKFENIKDNWYKATYKLGTEPWGDNGVCLAGKICLIYTDDSSWEGQATNPSIIDDYTTADASYNGDLLVFSSGLLYVKIGGWQTSECVAPEEYHLTVLVPEFCDEEFPIIVIGSFCGWDAAKAVHMTKVEGNKFTATILANANAEWKIRHEEDWSLGEIKTKCLDEESPEYDTWVGIGNNVLGAEHEVLVDYSDPELFIWNICE